MRGDHWSRPPGPQPIRGPPPACAGTTPRQGARLWAGRDHPRMRGDHFLIRRPSMVFPGPPPHARGPHSVGVGPGQHIGTTPACAGTTQRTAPNPACARDHPRMRGDHGRPQRHGDHAGGPPPHARGPRPGLLRPGRRRGTTPACAGTTAWRFAADEGGEGPPPHARGPQGVTCMFMGGGNRFCLLGEISTYSANGAPYPCGRTRRFVVLVSRRTVASSTPCSIPSEVVTADCCRSG